MAAETEARTDERRLHVVIDGDGQDITLVELAEALEDESVLDWGSKTDAATIMAATMRWLD